MVIALEDSYVPISYFEKIEIYQSVDYYKEYEQSRMYHQGSSLLEYLRFTEYMYKINQIWYFVKNCD